MQPQEWHVHLTSRLGIGVGFEEFCAAWNRVLDPVTILDAALFEGLGKRYRLGLLSNTDPLHAAEIESRFSFPRYFAARIYSCRVGTTKPSPAIYQKALAALGLQPAEALYIDDVPEFAAAAQGLGMDAICFENPEQLMAEFNKRAV